MGSRRFHSIFLDILGVLHLADCVLFFGCRNSNKDFFFREQWCPLVENGSLKLFTAFSRDQVSTYHTCRLLFQEIRNLPHLSVNNDFYFEQDRVVVQIGAGDLSHHFYVFI